MNYTLSIEAIENGYLVTASKYNPNAYNAYEVETYNAPKRRYVQNTDEIGPIFVELLNG